MGAKIKVSEAAKSEYVLVTPELAKKWKTLVSPKQRPISPTHVEELSRRRVNGEWREDCTDRIEFDTDGYIINGQHRIQMVIETGLPTKFEVTYNRDAAAAVYTDAGLRRKPGHQLVFEGVIGKASCERLGAIARSICLFVNTSVNRPSVGELSAVLRTMSSDIECVREILPCKGVLGRAPIHAGFAIAFRVERKAAEIMCLQLAGKADRPRGCMANALQTHMDTYKLEDKEMVNRVLLAVSRHRDGRKTIAWGDSKTCTANFRKRLQGALNAT